MSHLPIVHFSQDFARGKAQLGGYGRIYNLCLDNNQHIIFTISKITEKLEEFNVEENIKVVSFPLPLELNRVNQLRYYKVLGREIGNYLITNNINPLLFFGHSHLFNFFALNYVRNHFFKNKKVLWEANMVWGIAKAHSFRVRIANQVNKLIQKKIFRLADLIVCQTRSTAELIAKDFNADVEKCITVPNAINLGQVESMGNLNKSHIRNGKKIYQVLCLGLFDSMNGIPFLVNVLDENELSNFDFTFVGDGAYRSEVERIVKKNRCTYLGKLPYVEMQKKYADFDFVIIPRLKEFSSDLFIPSKLIEAMFYGLVPICSNVEAMKNIVKHGKNGFTFVAGDRQSLVNLFNEIQSTSIDLTQLSKEAIKTVIEEYTWSSNYKVLNSAYSKFGRSD